MQEKQGLRADAYTYSLLMNGYAVARQPDMAFKLVSPLTHLLQPGPISYT